MPRRRGPKSVSVSSVPLVEAMEKLGLLSVLIAIFRPGLTLGLPKESGCGSSEYYSRITGSCQPCTVCPWNYVVECSAYSNAICADQGTTKNPTQRIRETVLNSSRRKDEFLRQLRLEQLERDQGLGRKRGDEEDVDGEIKYSAEDSALRKRHDLHYDLQKIEREFIFVGGDKSEDDSEVEVTTQDELEAVTPTASEIVLGKKRLFGNQMPFPSSDDIDVFGAVMKKPTTGSSLDRSEDEFGLLHSLLYHSNQDEDGSSSTSSLMEHGGLILSVFLLTALVLLLLGLIVKKWRHVRNFKMLDDESPGLGMLSPTSSSSRRRSAESRVTTHTTSAPTSPNLSSTSTTTTTTVVNNGGQGPQLYLSYVDENGKTSLKGRELPV